ncbi:MAG: glycosyltransferase family 2 protein [Thermodesulfobacteriota bacterium]
MSLCIVSTLYKSAGHLEEFHARVSAAAQALTPEYSIILVDDGSPDASLEIARRLCARDPRLTVVELSRNHGQHRAIMAGLALADADLVFLLDSDLEESPEWLSLFHARMEQEGADVVYGVQEQRKGGAFERLSGEASYRLFNLLSGTVIPRNITTARLMRREYVDALRRFGERELFLAGLWVLAGFRQIPYPVEKGARGESSYTLGKKISLLVNGVTSFSAAPLYFLFYLGLGILGLSGLYLAYRIALKAIQGTVLPGFTTLAVSVWLLGGLVLFGLGVVGIYLNKVYTEVKQRPLAIIRAVHGRGAGSREGGNAGL